MPIIQDASTINLYQDLVFGAANGAVFGQFFDLTDFVDVETLSADISQFNPAGVRAFGSADVITGSFGTDVVNGNQDNDFLDGVDGDDYLRGGRNDDTVDGGFGDDVVNGNRDNDIVNGEDGNDFVRGGQGNDAVNGGNGNDIIVGDFGIDDLTGGFGADTFVFRAATAVGQFDPNSADVALDFNAFEGDRVVVVSDFGEFDISISIEDVPQVQATASSLDAVLRSFATNEVIGVVAGVSDVNTVLNVLEVVNTSDPALGLG
ncbi:Hemolysin-type calcium-binding region [Thalassoporum mexicanum PCC 7367]|uniref:calcium-binding protein n=1 Tax=Thalassoporum mexicanum TaxID=3457544 RepID=UPI00029FEE71|nr:calcium-binding protein [Pseudanabaena sp. PCC 7367]AFY70062.1 Hemolysin-type calcium-binding region [Pseudanabaena sp. PCC 7367]